MNNLSIVDNLAKWERYAPVSIGIEDMFKRLDAFADHTPNFPVYNLIKLNDTQQQLQVALAGYKKEDIEVALEKKVLNICVSKSYEAEGEYVHKGIAQRSFSRNWQLSDDTNVSEVTYIDGLLKVTLEKKVAEEDKRMVLPIA